MLRTHTCGELRKENGGQTATLCGWVAARRDHGKLIFIDIRDRYGITQVVFVPSVSKEAHQVAEKLGPEFVVRVTGEVVVRPDKMVNADVPTGEVEICANALEILNESEVPVFEIDDTVDVSEELRRHLPLLVDRDPEGVDMAAQMCSARLEGSRARIRAEQFLAEYERISGHKVKRKILRDKVLALLSELDNPEFGEPGTGPGSMKIEARVTGEPIVNAAFNRSVVRNQIRSIISAGIVLFIIIAVLFRSVGAAAKVYH